MQEKQKKASMDEIVSQIIDYVPIMAGYYQNEMPLNHYAEQLKPTNLAPEHIERQELSAQVANQIYQNIFGEHGRFEILPDDIRAVNIVDHHQLLNHPLLLGTNIIPNAANLLDGNNQRPIVTLSCSNVPADNYYMRRGFTFRDRVIQYFRPGEKGTVMYYADSRRFDFVERLQNRNEFSTFSASDQEFLIFYQETLNNLSWENTGRHRDQLSAAIRETWPLLFEEKLRCGIPELAYISLEDFASDMLIKLLHSSNFVSDFLLNEELTNAALDAFRGVVIAWDEDKSKGTHFFWKKHPNKPGTIRMYIKDRMLVPMDDRFASQKIPMTKEALCENLSNGTIIPASSTIISILFYSGVRLLVGPGSLVYTTKFKSGWLDLLERFGYSREKELVSSIDNRGLIAGAPLFFKRLEQGLHTQYAADIMADGGADSDYLNIVLQAKLKDILSVGATGVYDLFANTYIPANERLTHRVNFDEAADSFHHWVK